MGGVVFYFMALRHAGRSRLRAAMGAVKLVARDLVELAREAGR